MRKGFAFAYLNIMCMSQYGGGPDRCGDNHSVIWHSQKGDKTEECKVECKNEYAKDDRFSPNVPPAPAAASSVVVMLVTVVGMIMMIPFSLKTALFLVLRVVAQMGTVATAQETGEESTRPEKFRHVCPTY